MSMSSPEVVSYPNAAALLRVVRPGLERKEAENNLLLGVLMSLAGDPGGPDSSFVTVDRAHEWSVVGVMSPPRPLLLCADGAVKAEDLRVLAEHLDGTGLPVAGVVARSELAERFAEAWTSMFGGVARLRFRQRLHGLRTVAPTPRAAGKLRPATLDDVDLVGRWFAAFEREALAERDEQRAFKLAIHRVRANEVYLWVDAEPRAIAAKGRPTANTVAINAVYTPPVWRGRGYATSAVAELSGRLLGDGYSTCVLYTDVANSVSNSIYRRIGYKPLADSQHIDFVAASER